MNEAVSKLFDGRQIRFKIHVNYYLFSNPQPGIDRAVNAIGAAPWYSQVEVRKSMCAVRWVCLIKLLEEKILELLIVVPILS